MTDTANSFAEWRVLAPTAPERPASSFSKIANADAMTMHKQRNPPE